MNSNLNHKDVGHGTEHVSRAKDQAIVNESQRPVNWVSGIPRAVAVICLLLAVIAGVRGCKAKSEAEKAKGVAAAEYARAHPPAPPEFPLSGEGHATKQVGLKVWLDPMKTYVRTSKPARYVFVEDTDLFYDNTENARV